MLEVILNAFHISTDLILVTTLSERHLTDWETHTVETEYLTPGLSASKWQRPEARQGGSRVHALSAPLKLPFIGFKKMYKPTKEKLIKWPNMERGISTAVRTRRVRNEVMVKDTAWSEDSPQRSQSITVGSQNSDNSHKNFQIWRKRN